MILEPGEDAPHDACAITLHNDAAGLAAARERIAACVDLSSALPILGLAP